MPRRVITSRVAARGFQAARKWLLQPGSGANGARTWRALLQARRTLRDHPYIGVQDANQPIYRVLVVSDYRLVYRVLNDTGDHATAGDIRIVAVFGPGQAPRPIENL
jgi:plasmid stabilization system protein ParE